MRLFFREMIEAIKLSFEKAWIQILQDTLRKSMLSFLGRLEHITLPRDGLFSIHMFTYLIKHHFKVFYI